MTSPVRAVSGRPVVLNLEQDDCSGGSGIDPPWARTDPVQRLEGALEQRVVLSQRPVVERSLSVSRSVSIGVARWLLDREDQPIASTVAA
jgi:hypothetical protein